MTTATWDGTTVEEILGSVGETMTAEVVLLAADAGRTRPRPGPVT
jgi:hypothetical protein